MSTGIQWGHVCVGPRVAINMMMVISAAYHLHSWKGSCHDHHAFNCKKTLFVSPSDIVNGSRRSYYDMVLGLLEPVVREGGDWSQKLWFSKLHASHIVTERGRRGPALLSATLTDSERSSPDFCLDHITLSAHWNGTGQTGEAEASTRQQTITLYGHHSSI